MSSRSWPACTQPELAPRNFQASEHGVRKTTQQLRGGSGDDAWSRSRSVCRGPDGSMGRWADGERGGRWNWRAAMRKRRETGREGGAGVGRHRAGHGLCRRIATPRVRATNRLIDKIDKSGRRSDKISAVAPASPPHEPDLAPAESATNQGMHAAPMLSVYV